MMMIFAFDVDDTLEISNGPVPIIDLRALREAGHVVGICGNWAVLVQQIPDWPDFINFLGPMEMTKPQFLSNLGSFVPADRKVVVGNIKPSQDQQAAQDAGWDFILERDWDIDVVL